MLSCAEIRSVHGFSEKGHRGVGVVKVCGHRPVDLLGRRGSLFFHFNVGRAVESGGLVVWKRREGY